MSRKSDVNFELRLFGAFDLKRTMDEMGAAAPLIATALTSALAKQTSSRAGDSDEIPTFQCDHLTLPRAFHVEMALGNFALVVANGVNNCRHPGIAIQLADDYAEEFPEFMGLVRERFAPLPDDKTDVDVAIRFLTTVGANMGHDLLSPNGSVDYVIDVMDGLSQAWASEDATTESGGEPSAPAETSAD